MNFVDSPGSGSSLDAYQYPQNSFSRHDTHHGNQPTSHRSLSDYNPHARPVQRPALPPVGQVRCYWTLLSSELRFLVLDPVLAFHLQEQSSQIINTSLLDFVHPEEQASAREDLGGVINDRTLHGSVTRVRYCRLSRVRRLLGYDPSPSTPLYPPSFPAERIVIDSNYMAVDIVINWVADDLVLCFIHAVVDLKPQEDNDEARQTGWTNWCRTNFFEEEQVQMIYKTLYEVAQQRPSTGSSSDKSLRVLQILRNEHERHLLLTWPPNLCQEFTYHNSVPNALDLARLAQHVQIGSALGGAGSEAKTSCTRRYKSFHTLPVHTFDGDKSVQVESIFIPHGTIIFACHKVHEPPLLPASHLGKFFGRQNDVHSGSYYTPSGTAHSELAHDQFYAVQGSSYELDASDYTAREQSSPDYAQRWVERMPSGESTAQSVLHHTSALNQVSSLRSSSSSHPAPASDLHEAASSQWMHSAQNSHNPLSASDFMGGMDSPFSESYDEYAGSNAAHSSPSATMAEGAITPHDEGNVGSVTSTTEPSYEGRPNIVASTTKPVQEASGGVRRPGTPPIGVMQCTSCKTAHSPEWRKGPSGKKDLCNACGLRYARSRAKKEGSAPRKKKEKISMPAKRDLDLSSVAGAMAEKSKSLPKSSQQSLATANRARKQSRRATLPTVSPDQSESVYGASVQSAEKGKSSAATHIQQRPLSQRPFSELPLSSDVYPPMSNLQHEGHTFFSQRATGSSDYHREKFQGSNGERQDNWDRPPQTFVGVFEPPLKSKIL